MKDDLIMKRFFEASAEALGAGLRHARKEDPAVYAEIADLLARGLFAPEMVIKFKPVVSVSMRLVATSVEKEGDQPMVIEVFGYGGPITPPHSELTH